MPNCKFKITGVIFNFHPIILKPNCKYDITVDNNGVFSFVIESNVSLVLRLIQDLSFSELTYFTIFGSYLKYSITKITEIV